MTPRAKAFAAHIEAICEANRIAVEYADMAPQAVLQDRSIRIRPIKGDVTYAAAMHEIGHIIGRWKYRATLVEETGAWLWAEKNALTWSRAMKTFASQCLTNYYNYRNTSDYVPPKRHEFWRILNAR